MDREQPISLPDDLDEDWRLAQLTEAQKEPTVTVLEEWKQAAIIQPAFVIPAEWPALPKDCVEPAPSVTNEWLYAAAALRPGELDPNRLDVLHTRYVMDMLGYKATDPSSVQLVHWARLVGFDLMGTKFRHSSAALNTFYDSVATRSQWQKTTKRMQARCEQDPSWEGLVSALAAFMANDQKDQIMVQKVIALTIAQVEHWRAIDSVRRTRQFAKRALREIDPNLIEPSPILRAYRYEGADLWHAPMEQLTDTDGEVIAADVEEPAQSERGVTVHSMILLWNALPLFYENDGRDAKHTRNMMNRIGKPGDSRVLEATWVRRVVLRYMNVHIDQAPDVHYLYSREHKLSGTGWMEHSQALRRELKWGDPELEQLVKDCMELIDLPEECYEFCMRIAALQHNEVCYWRDRTAFARAVKEATEDLDWTDAIQAQCADPSAPIRFVEPQLRDPHMAVDVPSKYPYDRYGPDSLVDLSLEEIIDSETGEQRPAVVQEPYTSEDMARLQRAQELERSARIYLAKRQNDSYSRHARKLANRLSGERVGSEQTIALVHTARFMAFAVAGSSYETYNWITHIHSRWGKKSSDEVIDAASSAVQTLYKEHPEWSSEIDTCVRVLSADSYEQNLARHVMCLTIYQLLDYQAAYAKDTAKQSTKKRKQS